MTGLEIAASAATAAAASSAAAGAAAAGTGLAAGFGGAAAGVAAGALGTGAALTAPAWLTTLSTAATIGSGLISAFGAIQSGNAQQDALNANAATSRVNAGTALATSEAEAARGQDRARRTVAGIANQGAASGIDISSGSPLDVMADAAAQGALDTEIQRWKGRSQSSAYMAQAGQQDRQAGDAGTAGYVGAGTALLSTAARYATARLPPVSRGY
jgi:hypothetical protein